MNSDETIKWKYLWGGNLYDDADSLSVASDGSIYGIVFNEVSFDESGTYSCVALNSDGSFKWKYNFGSYHMLLPPVIGSDGTVYVTDKGHLDPDVTGKLYALNSDGTLKWTYGLSKGWMNSPAISYNGTIYFAGYNELYALNLNGTLKWKSNIASNDALGYYGALLIGSDGTIYISAHYLYAVNSTGALIWKYQVGTGDTQPVIVSDGTLYALQGRGLFAFKDSDTTPPTITNTNPTDGSTNLASSKTITVTFNETIKKGSSFAVKLLNSIGTAIAYTYSISGKVLTIDPKSNLAESKYKLVLNSGCVTDFYGNPFAGKNISFSVGTSPKVASSNPTSGATKVARNKSITVTFNENIKSGTNYSKITLKSSTGKTITISKSISGKVLTIKHSALLATKTKYTLTIYSAGIIDLAGNPLAAKTITFTTGNS